MLSASESASGDRSGGDNPPLGGLKRPWNVAIGHDASAAEQYGHREEKRLCRQMQRLSTGERNKAALGTSVQDAPQELAMAPGGGASGAGAGPAGGGAGASSSPAPGVPSPNAPQLQRHQQLEEQQQGSHAHRPQAQPNSYYSDINRTLQELHFGPRRQIRRLPDDADLSLSSASSSFGGGPSANMNRVGMHHNSTAGGAGSGAVGASNPTGLTFMNAAVTGSTAGAAASSGENGPDNYMHPDNYMNVGKGGYFQGPSLSGGSSMDLDFRAAWGGSMNASPDRFSAHDGYNLLGPLAAARGSSHPGFFAYNHGPGAGSSCSTASAGTMSGKLKLRTGSREVPGILHSQHNGKQVVDANGLLRGIGDDRQDDFAMLTGGAASNSTAAANYNSTSGGGVLSASTSRAGSSAGSESMTNFQAAEIVQCGHGPLGSCLQCCWTQRGLKQVPYQSFLIYSYIFQSLSLPRACKSEMLVASDDAGQARAGFSTAAQFGLRSLVAGEVVFASFSQICAAIVPERFGEQRFGLSSTTAGKLDFSDTRRTCRFVDLGSGLGKAVVIWALLVGDRGGDGGSDNDGGNGSNHQPEPEPPAVPRGSSFDVAMDGGTCSGASASNRVGAPAALLSSAATAQQHASSASTPAGAAGADGETSSSICAVGIEIRKTAHDMVEQRVLPHLPDFLRNQTRFVHGDFFTIPLQEADVVLINGTGLDAPTFGRLREKLSDELRPGARIISLSLELPTSRNFRVWAEARTYRMSWGNCTVHFHEKV
mmetsp:Transcript_22238/g.56120  ORF Transcript_22238/g.56120 Transcript_22238/m.56120 type:complete len:766 (+) Transcript_22238:139-2436(+)